MDINQIRQKYPQYGGLSDNQLAEKLHAKFYSNIDFDEFSSKIGLGEKTTVKDRVIGGLEAAGTVASSIVAEPVAGLAGIAQSLNPMAEPGAGAKAVESTREALTFQPRTEAGQQSLQTVGETLKPVGEFISGIEQGLGDSVFEATGSPALASAATAIPTAIAEITGLTAAKGVKALKRLSGERAVTKATSEAAPTIDQLKETSRAVFKEIDDLGASIAAPEYSKFVDDISNQVQRMGVDKDVTPAASKALERFAEKAETGVTLTELTTLREVAQGAASSLNKKEAAMGVMMIDAVDEFISNLDSKAITTRPDAAAVNIGERYKVARELWGRARRSELIQEAFEKARNQASGFENGIRVQMRSILNNRKQRKFFNRDELAAMTKVVRGGKGENIAKFLGRFGFGEGASTGALMTLLGSGAGAAVLGPAGAVAVPVAGQISRNLAQRMTKGNAEFADQVIRAGKSARKITKAYLDNTPKAQRNSAELSELLMKQDIDLETIPNNVIAIEAARLARQKRAELAAAATAGASSSAAADEQ